MSFFYSEDSYVKELNPLDFEKNKPWQLNYKDCAMVLFYVPWCPYCQEVKEEWNNFASMNSICKVFAFNCDAYKEHTNYIRTLIPHLIRSYPTICFYKNGEPISCYKNQKRTAELFLEECMKFCSSKSIK